MIKRVLPAISLLSWTLGAWAGDELIIDIDLAADLDVVLPQAIDTANANNGPVRIRFQPGTHRFDAAPPGVSRTPPISGEIVFSPVSNGSGIVILDGNQGNARGFDITSSGQVTFDHIQISNFSSPSDGGGIFNNGGDLTLIHSTISGNTAAANGGGLVNIDGALNVTNSTISGNTATSGDGGGIFNSAGTLTFSQSTISGNSASMNGGGIYIDDSDLVALRDATVVGNTAALEGGGLWNSSTDQFTFNSVTISANSASAGGGIFLGAGDDDMVQIRDLNLANNVASGDGGGMGIDLGDSGSSARFTFSDVEVRDNEAGINGGGIDIFGNGDNSTVLIRNIHSQNNRAGVFGEHFDVNVSGAGTSPVLVIQDGILLGSIPGVVGIENPDGVLALLGLIVEVDGKDAIDTTDRVLVGNTIFGTLGDGSVPKRGNTSKATCNTFGVGVIQSLGGNISLDADCDLTDATDQQNADAMVLVDPATGNFGLGEGSAAIDAALPIAATLFPGEDTVLDCGYKDVNGLGRPQDGNLDGVFECDVGFVEKQGGLNIGAAQSSAYFDTGRNGEGVFVELIGGGLAFVAVFTYLPDASGAAWFVGIGSVVGNSVVVDDLLQVRGGVFGAAFDPNTITRSTVGGMSLVFPACEAVAQPGRITFQSAGSSIFSDLQVQATRLSTIVDCAGGTGSAQSGRSGSFFDVSRSGEGIFVQWLTDGRVVVIWYTFDTNGNPLWVINDGTRTTVSGNTVTATMVYPTSFTSFGSGFDSADVALSDWGTVTLEYQPGCNDIAFGFDATAPGFGSGGYDYTRLTGLTGTSCDL